jgi:ceramide glucosyltransferase
VAGAVAVVGTVWYGGEMLLAAASGWPVPALFPVHAMLRDLLLPILWLNGWRERGFVWRGNPMTAAESDQAKIA